MKSIWLVFSLVALLGLNVARAGDLRYENPMLYSDLRDQVLAPLFQAMQAGDLATIKRYLHGMTYEQYRILLEENKNYSQFLKNYYAGATFEVGQIVTVDRDYVADMLIHWSSGQTSVVKLHVAPDRGPTPTTGLTPSSVPPITFGTTTYNIAPEPERRMSPPQLKH